MSPKSETVGVRELRQNLSVYLTRVKKGQAMTVTEHGQPVAELRPLVPERDPLARLVAEGHVRAAGRPLSALPRPLRLSLEKPVSDLLNELRGDSI